MILFNRRRGLRALPALMLMVALALSVAACDTDELVAVRDPEQLRPEDLEDLGSVPALVAGALRQFVGGYSGLGLDDAFLSASAVISDEFYFGDTFNTRAAADRRTLLPPVLTNITDDAYGRLHQARFNSRRAVGLIDQFSTPTTAAEDAQTKAQLRTIEGYVFVTLSEGWCGAVPFSRLPDTGPVDPTNIDFAPGIGTNAMNDSAVVRFNEALALHPTNRLAAVGKGRALLNRGLYAEAAAAVAAVPSAFVFHLEHSENEATQNNPIASLQLNGRYGVSNLEGATTPTGLFRPDAPTSGTAIPPATAPGAEGLPFRGLADPRVPWATRAGNACFSAVRCWRNMNYPDFNADVPLASGVEARLIEAEAALQVGDVATMMTRLNFLRTNVAALLSILYPDQVQVFDEVLPLLVDPGSAEARRELLFNERALWLFNTGHRQGDLRRLSRHYGLPSREVFPSGPHFRGQSYGDDVAYPVPFNEDNNPEFDRAACVTTEP